ncbi:unnamed protein product [Paramecium pentaurelia]|uniref:C2H2-type domain-containing protein n=1 Tax=Paramecium pentaurelia TaxID=43138 RepID=A0A8S1WAW3_9CILI|nr:unnamed protein product [Paramecium pentaurelia]
MKYIPLTQHFETVAALYEKCATMSEQLEALQKQSTLSNGQLESEDTQQPLKNSPKPTEKQKIKQQKKQLDNIQIADRNDKMIEEKQKSQNTDNKIKKQIQKQQTQIVQFSCDHCNKTFETQKIYNKHIYQLKYREKQLKRKQKQQAKDAIQVEQPIKKGKKDNNNNKKTGISIELSL